ncbi:MAG: nicotinate-nucleotide adenylyltransferase [Fimbriimonas sp.]
MRIGILGGTFDPPHIGHLALATAAIEQLGLEEVIFMPTFRNPIKGRKVTTKPKDRLAMVEALVKGSADPHFAMSDLEVTREGPSYTVDTMAELQMVRPAEYWFLMGADSLRSLPEWKQPTRLVRLCRLGVVVRPPTTEIEVRSRIPEDLRDHVDVIQMKPVDISSTEIRERVSRKQNVGSWVPVEVLRYISTHKLYQE